MKWKRPRREVLQDTLKLHILFYGDCCWVVQMRENEVKSREEVLKK